ncbi:GTP-binding protein [Acorus gramineus]|uniref:GTP-binding protein n=1 Tax=Acorus gramineus TaxID=55184 RepID=A0AAV9ASB7_ACOGR|nr:GTP-binding protein [Acorus gramineus]
MGLRLHHHQLLRLFATATSTSTKRPLFPTKKWRPTKPIPTTRRLQRLSPATTAASVAIPETTLPLETPSETEGAVPIPLERLFVPPGVEFDPESQTKEPPLRVLTGSNIVLSPLYARDAQVTSAEFVKSSKRKEDCPADGLPEFALVGRSNVGKSSLLNSIVRRKKLALTSKKPDASIPAKKIDLDYASWLGKNQIPMTMVFTKCDKRKKRKNGGKRPEENVEDFQDNS